MATHLSERTGKGNPLIVSTFGKEAFDISDSSIKVTIPYNWQHKFESEPIDKLSDKLVDKLTKTEIRILDLICMASHLSQPEIASQLGVGKTTIQNAIIHFKQLGIIERIGANKNGYWKVIDYGYNK